MKKIQDYNYYGDFTETKLNNEINDFKKRLEILNNEKYNYIEIISDIPIRLSSSNEMGIRTIYQIEKEKNIIGNFDVFRNLEYNYFTIYVI